MLTLQQLSKGGGQNLKAAKHRGRQSGEAPRAVIEHIKLITPPLPLEDQNPHFISTPLTKKLTCSVCSGIVNRPVQLSCECIVCSDCCCKAIQTTYSPCCTEHTLSSSTIHPPSPLLMSLVNDFLISCVRKCGKTVKLQKYEKHLKGSCKSHYEEMSSQSKVTLRDVLSKPSTSPATPAEVKAAHHLVYTKGKAPPMLWEYSLYQPVVR